VTKSGTGTGSVTTSTGSLSWTVNTGTVAFASDTVVTLSGQADAGSAFAGWSGACTGTGDCTLTVNAAKAVTATFADTTVPVVAPSKLGGSYAGPQTVTLSSDKAGTIYYTLDGSDPSVSVTRFQYTAPISMTTTTILKYYALDAIGNASLVQTQIYAITANAWTRKADFGGAARYSAVAFSIGSKGYAGTGHDGSFRKDFWEYDPALNAWTQEADFGGAGRAYAVGFSIAGMGYIATGVGNGSTYYKDLWQYDPTLNAWTQKADFGGAARSAAVGFSIGSKGYVGTGQDGSYRKDFWEYDSDANMWTQKADVGGTVRGLAIGFSIGTKGYIGTGFGDGSYKKDFWEYDPDANTWNQKADFGGTPRRFAVGFSIGSKGYAGTGYDHWNSIVQYRKDFWEYDPDADTWTQKADFAGTARGYTVAFSIGGKGYIGTGIGDGSSRKDFWEYDPGPLTLHLGWNFISLPLTPPDVTVDRVLSPVSSKTTIVWGYDSEAKIWKKWTPGGGAANTLLTMEPGKGYWIFMSQAVSLDISSWGALVSPSTVLNQGWNLVGYAGVDGRSPALSLAPFSGMWSIVWTWENGQWHGKHATITTLPAPIQPLSVFSRRKAFWIKLWAGATANWAQ
jgi:hypothetical protein